MIFFKKKEIPDTAQKSIPFIRMYQDGICHVKDNFYTKMIEFGDINYSIVSDDEKENIKELYESLLNYFSPDFKIQIFLFNRRVNKETLMEQYDISFQEDDYNDCRKEYAQMLNDVAVNGNNGIIKSKYLIFGTNCKNLKEARNKFSNIESDIIKNFMNLESRVNFLDGKERLRILHEYFNQDTREPFKYSYDERINQKDIIAPPGFDFRFPSRFRSGGMYGKAAFVSMVAPNFNDDFVKNIIEINESISVSVHLQTIEMLRATKLVKKALSDVQKTKIDEQKNANKKGYDRDIIPTDIVAYEQDLLDLIRKLNTSNQKLFYITFLITVFGDTKEQMLNLYDRVSAIIGQGGCNLRCLQYLQEQGLMASGPIGLNETEITRVLPTECIATLMPFNTLELCMESPSLYYGINAISKNMIMADRKRLRNPNGVILGTPGSGKSFSAKREILGSFLLTRDDILISDPEGEYFPLVQALKGQVIRLAADSKDYLNPLDITFEEGESEIALKHKSDFIITLCDLIAGGKDGLQSDEKGIIDECIRKIYQKYISNPIPENMPILGDLYEALKDHPDNKAARLAGSLVLYVSGSQNFFNHQTNVDSNNRIVCFDIKELSNQLKEIGMLIVQDAVWNRVSQNRKLNVSTRFYVDEAHLLLKEKQTAQYTVEIWKRFRKWGGIPTAITQNVSDFLKSDDVEEIIGNSDFIYLLNQGSNDMDVIREKFKLSASQLKYVSHAEQGSGLIIYDGVVVPFIDRYPQNTKTFEIMNTKMVEA